jgi:stage II sporulation SpoE-like protein
VRRPLRGSALYWRKLQLRTLGLVLTGIFFTFASSGFIIDSLQFDAQRPWAVALYSAFFSGMVAVLFALIPMRSVWFLPIAMLFMLKGARFSVPLWIGPSMGAPTAGAGGMAAIRHRAVVDGMATIVCVTLGYIAFIRFIRTEGMRQTRLRAEMDLARQIHASLVPPIDLATTAFEARGRSVPSSEVGGDLVDAFERGGYLSACVADVAGHGVPAGALMAMMRGALRPQLSACAKLETLLADVNRLLVDLGRPDRFVTLACLRFDGTGGAEYALAGHLPILRIRSGAAAVERFENPSPPLGVQPDAAFTSGRVTTAAGDLFAIFTDGLSEVRDRARREFGIERIEALLLAHAARPLGEIEREVFAAAERHGKRLDDQTLLLVRVS